MSCDKRAALLRPGAVRLCNFNPATASATYNGDVQAQAACAAVAYAITRGNLRAVQDFSRLDISGLVV